MAGSLLSYQRELLALAVKSIQFAGQLFGLGRVFGLQELVGALGMVHSPGSVEPWPQCVADGGGVHLPRLEASLPAECLDAWSLHVVDARQPTVYQRAVLAQEGDQVGHGPQGDQVQQILFLQSHLLRGHRGLAVAA